MDEPRTSTDEALDELQKVLDATKEKVIDRLNSELLLDKLDTIIHEIDMLATRVRALEAKNASRPFAPSPLVPDDNMPWVVGDQPPYGNVYCGTKTDGNLLNPDSFTVNVSAEDDASFMTRAGS